LVLAEPGAGPGIPCWIDATVNKHDGAGLAKRARQPPPDLPIVYACGRSGYRAIGALGVPGQAPRPGRRLHAAGAADGDDALRSGMPG